jgi:Uma2 family endonuclease
MALSTPASVPEISSEHPVNPLENGDHLSRGEFERRYEAMSHLPKAELIEGVVYVPSPVRHRLHGRPHTHVITWLGQYEARTPGVEASDNSTVRLDLDNEAQPDALLFVAPARGGQTQLSEDGFIEGAPELIVEVASSSASYDLHTKLNVYRRNGVREYVVWRVLDQAIDWFVLRDGEYERMSSDADGLLCSEVFAGLWLDPAALCRGDIATVLDVLDQGLASPEHAAFAARMNSFASPPDSED